MIIKFDDTVKPKYGSEKAMYLKDYYRQAYESVSAYTLVGYTKSTGYNISYTDAGISIPDNARDSYFDMVESFDDMHIDDIEDMCKDAGIKHIDYADADDAYAYLFDSLSEEYYKKGKGIEKRLKDIQRLESNIDTSTYGMQFDL